MWKTICTAIGGLVFEAGALMLIPSSPIVGWALVGVGVLFLIWAYVLYIRDNQKQNNQNKISPTIKRISLIDFYKEAEKRGWDFSSDGSLHILDIAEGIRQAGLDGVVRTWGRKANMFDSITKSEPLLELPKTYWENYKLNAVAALKTIYKDNSGLSDDNFPISTHNIAGDIGGRCQDIHLHTEQSLEWLNAEAEQYKGRNKR
jgi:hypothetical protein